MRMTNPHRTHDAGAQRRRTAVIKHPTDREFAAVVKMDLTDDTPPRKSVTVTFPDGTRVSYYEQSSDDSIVIRRDGKHDPEILISDITMGNGREVTVSRVVFGPEPRT